MRRLRLRKDEDGGALIEFTIMAPVLFLIFFGIIEFGSLFNLQNNMVNAARDTARKWAARDTQTKNWQPQDAVNDCLSRLTGLGQTFVCVARDHCNDTPKQQDVSVEVRINDAAAASLVNYMGVFSGQQLSIAVRMRQDTACP
jgi:Flp pilus assembly protein TadG